MQGIADTVAGAAHRVQRARLALRQRQLPTALHEAHRAWALVHSRESAAVGALAAALLRLPQELALWRHRWATLA